MILMDDLGSWFALDFKELAALPSLSLRHLPGTPGEAPGRRTQGVTSWAVSSSALEKTCVCL